MPESKAVLIPEKTALFNAFPMTSTTHTVALIVAAGESRRMGGAVPKQYRLLGGKSVLRRSVEAFLHHPQVDAVCVVIHPEHAKLYAEAITGLDILPPAHGGETRQESVKNGLEHLFNLTPATHVLVHDAARCFVDAGTISRVVNGLGNAQAVLPTLPVADTIKEVEGDVVQATVPRLKLHIAQTPQGFDFSLLKELHLNAHSAESTDDASLAEAAGIAVHCVAGHTDNFKLTTQEDWTRAHMLTTPATETRTGMGFDVHRLIPDTGDKPLLLCGVAIPHSHVLEGHSDADVGLHALVDAILGALAIGDIGSHFPPSDARWKGADSAHFVRYCAERMHEAGAQLTHADITLICEAPKVSPHREAMRAKVAELLGADIRRISVKATTSEQLGFTGRREGIAAQAVATLTLPAITDMETAS